MTHATDVLFYTYEADVHCSDCAVARFGLAEGSPGLHPWVPEDAEDSEANPVSPVFASQSERGSETCGTCGLTICGGCGSTQDIGQGCDCLNCGAHISSRLFLASVLVAGAVDADETFDHWDDAEDWARAEVNDLRLRPIDDEAEVRIDTVYDYGDGIEGSQWGDDPNYFSIVVPARS